MINHVYYTLGKLNDPAGTGLSIAVYSKDEAGDWLGVMRQEDGTPFLGYLPNEVTEEDYLVWKDRIKTPDMVTYFPGIFPGVGVVNKYRYAKNTVARDKIQHKVEVAEITEALSRATKIETMATKLGVSAADLGEVLGIKFQDIKDKSISSPTKLLAPMKTTIKKTKV